VGRIFHAGKNIFEEEQNSCKKVILLHYAMAFGVILVHLEVDKITGGNFLLFLKRGAVPFERVGGGKEERPAFF
jgi:hypothetical protein